MVNFRILFLFLLPFLFLSACSDSTRNGSKCPCKVKIPQLQDDGSYKLEVVEIKTLEDVRKIRSSKIQVTINPRFFTDGSIDEITPEAQYVVDKNDVIIPTQTETAEMFSIYKTMEDLYFFDQMTGASELLSYPRSISLQARSNRTTRVLNNASFFPMFDHIVVFKYIGDLVPLSLNPGVIAHEHFHAIFNAIVKPIIHTIAQAKNLKSVNSLFGDAGDFTVFATKDEDLSSVAGYNYLILKSLDEGLADLWANVHTNLENPYLASYKQSEMKERDIVPWIYQLETQEELQEIFNFQKYKDEEIMGKKDGDLPIHGSIYGKAVKYSNLLKSVSDKIASTNKDKTLRKVILGRWIIDSLKRLAKVVEENGQSKVLSQGEILNSFVSDISASNSEMASICSDVNIFLTFHKKARSCENY